MKVALLSLLAICSSPFARAASNVTIPEQINVADICLMKDFRLTCLDRESNVLFKGAELFVGEAQADPSGIRLLRAMLMLKERGLAHTSAHSQYAEPPVYFFSRPRGEP